MLQKENTPLLGLKTPEKGGSEREIAHFDAIQTGGTSPSAQTLSGRLGMS